MATVVIMPRQGNSVESCLITAWKKEKGEVVAAGEVICEIETDKATMEVEAPASGTVLDLFFGEGEEVPVLTNIAVIGEPGEDVAAFRPNGTPAQEEAPAAPAPASGNGQPTQPATAAPDTKTRVKISPRARRLADTEGVNLAEVPGSGPGGRVMERDIQAVLDTSDSRPMRSRGGLAPPPVAAPPTGPDDVVEVIPLKGVRKVIAERMLASLQTTAQLTLNTAADARSLTAYRQRLKQSAADLGLQAVTINDLLLFAVARMLPQHPALNALFSDNTISQYQNVHLGLAVDTPKGLMVPVIRHANTLSLKQIAGESKRLAAACQEGTITADELQGGTFTMTNLGSLGIESFTPVLNPPQVAILGVGNINLKAVEGENGVEFIPHLGLSLTINHQVVDGAPAGRFLQALCQGLAAFELLLAL